MTTMIGTAEGLEVEMSIQFEWDPRKAELNSRKHGVSFDEAASVFGDPLLATFDDPLHSEDENRNISVGITLAGKLLLVVHADRGEKIRIISARPATRREREVYEQS